MRVAVIGGGIAGLAAAYRARELAAERGVPLELHVFEANARAGGCVETEYRDGFVLEMGPDSVVTEKPAAVALARRLGLGDDITPVNPEYSGACIVRGGRLVRIPSEFRLFTPLSFGALAWSGLFSPMGIARAALEPFIPRRRDESDESLASFIKRRFGREMLDRLAQPLIGGIYSGDPERLSMQATLPHMAQLERTHGSLVRSMRATAKATNGTKSQARLVTLRNGLEQLISALTRELGDTVRTGMGVASLRRGGDTQWILTLLDGSEVPYDAIICAVPAFEAARLLRSESPAAAEDLEHIKYHSVATVTFAYAADNVPKLPRCTGFVVPTTEKRSIMAATFTTQKYPGRSPQGYTVLRAFIGGASDGARVRSDDETLIETVRREYRELLAIDAQPVFTAVRRFPNAMPEYSVGHKDLVRRITSVTDALGGLALAGSAYYGVGISDCIRGGEEAADKLVTM